MGLGDPAQAGCSTPRQLFIFILKIRTNDPALAGLWAWAIPPKRDALPRAVFN